MTRDQLIETVRYCWNHAAQEEESVVVWMAEKIAERIDADPQAVDAFVFAATDQHVYAVREDEK